MIYSPHPDTTCVAFRSIHHHPIGLLCPENLLVAQCLLLPPAPSWNTRHPCHTVSGEQANNFDHRSRMFDGPIHFSAPAVVVRNPTVKTSTHGVWRTRRELVRQPRIGFSGCKHQTRHLFTPSLAPPLARGNEVLLDLQWFLCAWSLTKVGAFRTRFGYHLVRLR